MSVSLPTELEELYSKLKNLLNRVGAVLKGDPGDKKLVVELYGFQYTFNFFVDGVAKFVRSDGGEGIVREDNVRYCNNILLPFLEYVGPKDKDFGHEPLKEKSSDSAVMIHLLLPGDFFICNERIFCENAPANKTKTLYVVVPS